MKKLLLMISLSPSINWYKNSKLCLIFKGNGLKQKHTTYTPPNITISYYCL